LARALAGTFVAASSAEILIIAVQQWRGRPSHFNNATSGDTILFGLMGGLVAVMSIALLGLFIWSLIERPTNRLERLAGLAGMAMIMSGLGFGQWVLSLGGQYVDQFDRVPEVVTSGEAGVAKFPHAVAFHGIQVFMLAAAMLRRSAVPPRNAIRMLRIIVVAYLGALVFSALQSFGGRAPFDLDVVSGVLLVVSLAVLAWGMATTVRWWLTLPIGPEDAADPGRGRAGGDLSRPAVTAPARFEA
jgi:hypothetical protein